MTRTREQWVGDIQAGSPVNEVFLVRNKFVGLGKTGKSWLSLILVDKTGEIDGRIWDNAERAAEVVQEGDYLHIKGIGTSYLDKMQLKMQSWRVVPADEVNLEDFLPASQVAGEDSRTRIAALMDTMQNSHLIALWQSYSHDPAFMNRWEKAPAAKSIHHAYIGGLAEHTASMLEIAASVSDHYLQLGLPVNRDLLLMGVLLHDSGKIVELSQDPGFAYTDDGRLLGHIYLGARELENRIAGIDGFPESLRRELLHLILSHHGELEYGSPKRPKSLEAMLLTHIDNMDSKVQTWLDTMRRDKVSPGGWSSFVPSLGRYLHHGTDSGPDDGSKG